MSKQKEIISQVTSALKMTNAERLADGGQKSVWKGIFNGAPAVAKIIFLSGNPVNDQVTIIRAQREVDLLRNIDSPQVVRPFTELIVIGDPPQALSWIEEWLDGSDLTAHLHRQFTSDEAWKLIIDLAKGLKEIHNLAVVHRDLSPSNVRLKSDGSYVLMDPGFARYLAKTTLTGISQPGTLGWRSPEHIPGGEPVPSSDIFCLGILAFYCLTGQLPFDIKKEIVDHEFELQNCQAPSVASYRFDLDQELVAMIDKCLQREPSRRFSNGAELLGELKTLRKI
ncbi:serine/threonine protein kinase PknA [Corynebacterium kutscheri]|uniref:Protein kinase family protein n=1 Tax=Corynebacterium kutscheri TaxID=35755 RepID=A0A0F6TDH5_9CORY|nr:serine/threonine-protein kinase [Corynebacterium kutscheri]AKE41259.1 protein kinase family protein [Corynebacterium kutscheri]VEH08535.1 serine/threonine protein kinase PknA [Corynebacterium kutscheri]VEH09581.1 serine/threonine protein kinase PknA [Corynebacterium kutscheri]VEH79664.1 serine/threonine protein kinase PknA [Corynebacterium kutscheri]